MSNIDPQQPANPTQPTTPLPSYTAPQQSYPQQGYPQQPIAAAQQAAPLATPRPAPVPAPAPTGTTLASTNTFALLSIILAFISPLAAIIFGHLGLSQIKRTGDSGRGIALTGTIIGYAYFVFIALFVIFYIGMIIMMFGAMGAAFSSLDPYYYDDYSY